MLIIRHDCGFTYRVIITCLIWQRIAAIPVVLCLERVCHLGHGGLGGTLVVSFPRILRMDSQRNSRVLILRLESHYFRVFFLLILLILSVPVEHITVCLVVFFMVELLLLIITAHLILWVVAIILVLIIWLLLLLVAHLGRCLGHHLVWGCSLP